LQSVQLRKRYGCFEVDSSYILSRRGYQRFLFEEAEKRGVQFRFGSPAESIEDNTTRPVLILKNGDRIEADLIVGADGTYFYKDFTTV
jgi:salicylate hydroxylase